MLFMKFHKSFFVVLSLFCAFAFISAEANAQKSKNRRTQTKTIKISYDARRMEVEALMLRGEYQHDGSGELFYIGTFESVPALLKVLQDYAPKDKVLPREEEETPPPMLRNGVIVVQAAPKPPVQIQPKSYICTYIHAVGALRKITGQKFIEYQDWKNWWEEYRKTKNK